MQSGQDLREVKQCTACKSASFRQVIENVGKNSYFGVQGLSVEDPRTNQGEIVNGYLVLVAYICPTCGHVDLYSSLARK